MVGGRGLLFQSCKTIWLPDRKLNIILTSPKAPAHYRWLIPILILNINSMRKIGEQIRFEQTINFIEREFTALRKNPTQEKIQAIEPRLKELDKSLSKIEEALMADRKLNRTDVKHKIDEYKEERNSIHRQLEEIRLNLQKKELFGQGQGQTAQQGKLKNYRMLDELDEHNVHIERDFEETAGIIKDTKQQVGIQRQKIEAIEQQWEDADVELTVIDQFMRMISNRNLLTKIILVLLALFLGLADIAILFMKIS